MVVKKEDILSDISAENDLKLMMKKYYQELDMGRIETKIHPSSISSMCPKEYWYLLTGQVKRKQNVNSKLLLKRAITIHDEIQADWWDMGILAGDWLCYACGKKFDALIPTECPECKSPYLKYLEKQLEKKEWSMVGSADGILHISGDILLGEIKTTNIYTFGKIKGIHDRAYLLQIHCYMEMAGLEGCWVLYVERMNGQQKPYFVKKDPEIIKELDANITKLVECLDENKEPDIVYDPYNSYCDDRCIAKHLCTKSKVKKDFFE